MACVVGCGSAHRPGPVACTELHDNLELIAAFSCLDRNGSGVISHKQLPLVLLSLCRGRVAKPDADAVLNALNAGDGHVSYIDLVNRVVDIMGAPAGLATPAGDVSLTDVPQDRALPPFGPGGPDEVTTLLVANLPPTLTSEHLIDQFGDVWGFDFLFCPWDRRGHGLGYAILNFTDAGRALAFRRWWAGGALGGGPPRRPLQVLEAALQGRAAVEHYCTVPIKACRASESAPFIRSADGTLRRVRHMDSLLQRHAADRVFHYSALALEVVAECPEMFRLMPPKLATCSNFVRQAVARNGGVLQYVAEGLREKCDGGLAARPWDAQTLRYAPDNVWADGQLWRGYSHESIRGVRRPRAIAEDYGASIEELPARPAKSRRLLPPSWEYASALDACLTLMPSA